MRCSCHVLKIITVHTTQDPPVAGKQCFEDISPSVVEVLSEAEIPGKPSEESSELLSSDDSLFSEQTDGSPNVFPDYVTLNKDSVFLYIEGNSYVSQLVNGSPEVGQELGQTCHYPCSDGSSHVKLYSGNEMVNHSYLPVVEPADGKKCKICDERGQGNLYTNLPNK